MVVLGFPGMEVAQEYIGNNDSEHYKQVESMDTCGLEELGFGSLGVGERAL